MRRIDRAFAGHFIGAAACKFVKTTDCFVSRRNSTRPCQVRVSTVGEYCPGDSDPNVVSILGAGVIEIGYGRYYETMVFPLSSRVCTCGCGAPEVEDWSEIDFEGYVTRAEAERGHEQMVEKYLSGV